MSGEYGDNAQPQHESVLPGGPFVFFLPLEELEKVIRESELAKQPQEPGGGGEKNLYEQFPDSARRLDMWRQRIKPEAAPGELTGRYLIPQNGPAVLVDEKIGEGYTAEVYLCHDPQEKKEEKSKFVIKVCLPEKGSGVRIIESEIEALKLHNDDGPPIIPRYFGDGTIDGRRAYVMELMRDPTIPERFEQGGLYPTVEALNAILPFLDFLMVEERRGVIASDFKYENIRVAKNSEGEEYFRYLDYGLVPMEGVNQNQIRKAIAMAAGFINFTVNGRGVGPTSVDNMTSLSYWKLCMDMSKHQEFRFLPIGLQAILMKGLGFLDGGYGAFTDFARDVALLVRSLEKNQARIKLPDYRPSDLVARAIAASVDTTETLLPKKSTGFLQFRFREKKIEPPVNKSEQLTAEMEEMIIAARPQEVIESEADKRHRLIDWKDGEARHYLIGAINSRSVLPGILATFHEYLSVFPEDPEAVLWKNILIAMDTVDKSGIREKDPKFLVSYFNYLSSLIVEGENRNELLLFDQLQGAIKPLIELADKLELIAGVSGSGRPPDYQPTVTESREPPELTIQELLNFFWDKGLAINELKRRSPGGNLANLGPRGRQTALELIREATSALDAMEKQGVKFVDVAGNKIPIGQIRSRVEKDLKDLSGNVITPL